MNFQKSSDSCGDFVGKGPGGVWECLCKKDTFYTGGQMLYFVICGDLNFKHTWFS